MYKVLFVDDEPNEIQFHQMSISFADHGFDVVGEAHSGQEGVLRAEELRPDLVIAYIDMPYMDGLSMAEAMRQNDPAAQFIFLTGQENTAHMRRLLALCPIAYLQKPAEAEQMINALKTARLKLDEESNRLRNVSDLKQYYYDAIQLLKEMLFASLLSGSIQPEAAMEMAETYDLDLKANRYAIALIRCENMDAGVKKGLQPDALKLAVMNVVQEALNRYAKAHVFRYDGQLATVFLLPRQDPQMLETVTKALNAARNNVLRYLETDVLIGLSSPRGSLDQLPFILSQAAAAQDQCEIYGTNKVLAIVDIDPGSRQAAPNDTTGVRGLMTALKTNNQPRIKKELTGLFRALRDSKPTVKAYRGFLMEIVMALGSVIRNMDLPDERFNLLVRDLMALPLPEAAQELFEGLMNEMSEEIVAVREKAGRRIAFDAIDYLRAHYHDENLSIETICRILYVSSSYFSSVFKKETGQTFLQYLTDLRMSSALSILAQGERPINEVAKAVGFSDPSYFSYVFKKHYGLPPSQVSQFQQEEA